MLRLGEFQFEPESGQLSHGDEVRRLEPQPAKVLALLARRAGEVVSHEELCSHVWGEETHVDFERGLRYCIAQIRAALGDSAQDPRFIETLPKRGYRLKVPVVSEPGSIAPSGPTLARSRSWPLLAAASFLALLVAGWFWARPGSAPPSITVAVVPFDNETGEPALDGLARGFSDAVVARLAGGKPEQLAVVGNAAALFGPREKRDLQALGRELGAAYFVVGQVQRQDGRTRVIAHLIRTSDQKHLWADRFEQEEQGALGFEARVGERVAAKVRASLLDSSVPP